MLVSDCHKYFELKYKKRTSSESLVRSGLFYNCRNPNYLGEILVYLSFGILSNSYISYTILIFIWISVFIPNIICKEYSFIKKPDWKIYKQTSWIILPKIFSYSNFYSILVYLFIFIIVTLCSSHLSAYPSRC